MSQHVQFYTMLIMWGGGLALGVIFDIYRVLSRRFRAPRWLIPVLDLVYWLTGAVAVFRLLYMSNQGQVRLYIFVGLLAGAIVYFSFISNYVVRGLHLSITIMERLLNGILKVVEWILIKPILLIYRLILLIFSFLAVVTVYIYKIVVQLMHSVWKILFSSFISIIKWLRLRFMKK